MAKVIISGTIKNVSEKGRFSLWEKFTVQGRDVFRKWTVWAPVWGLTDGDWVEVEGDLGSKIGSYEKDGETRQVVDHSINEPVLIKHVPATPKPATLELDEEMPF